MAGHASCGTVGMGAGHASRGTAGLGAVVRGVPWFVPAVTLRHAGMMQMLSRALQRLVTQRLMTQASRHIEDRLHSPLQSQACGPGCCDVGHGTCTATVRPRPFVPEIRCHGPRRRRPRPRLASSRPRQTWRRFFRLQLPQVAFWAQVSICTSSSGF